MQTKLEYKYTIMGIPMVKKNTQRTVYKNGHYLKYNSKQFRAWEVSAFDQLWGKDKPAEPIDYPIILECHFYYPTKRRVDLSNLYEGIQDVLVKKGIIADDHCGIIIGHDGSRVHKDDEHPRMEISILKVVEQNACAS